jgi:hypothetical protein
MDNELAADVDEYVSDDVAVDEVEATWQMRWQPRDR